ncbi:VOC family protein [Psychrobacillus sp. Sa2BUA9]|uniref:VOC family protein n=1 Tax=Psychrobacillus faecigallinarum TaxID=2762235 RepID=A0ABR8R9R6_9BACI|nr:VOC family protein [Psychrobacillus faecigallinarum]MBD7944552.1 VOC family protein [Psychrobacillus faecigallinarum]
MSEKLVRVGTTYIPVTNVALSSDWYTEKLGAIKNYQDEDKAILNLANQSIFLVKSKVGETLNFVDNNGQDRFALTFEVDGLDNLISLHNEFIENLVQVGQVENRGHAGRNFVFEDPDGNKFDVWSELSPSYKEKFNMQ